MWRSRWNWSRQATILVGIGVTAILMIACGPEAGRPRDGGLGASSRPSAQPSKVTNPELVVPATMNVPYATDGPLPTLRPAAPPSGGGGTPVGSPGFPVPTNTSPGTYPILTPGAATPTR